MSLCCAESEAELATEINNGNKRVHAQTWFFRICVLLKDGKTFSDLLNARKKQVDTSLATASVITWALADHAGLESQDLNCVYIEGFMHSSTTIWLASLKRVLPENQMTDAGQIIRVIFEEVLPGPGNCYIFHPVIKKFLDETSLDPLAVDKRKREDYCVTRSSDKQLVQPNTWFGCGTMQCSSIDQVEEVFRSANVAHRQEETLGLASVITFACAAPAHESAASNIIQVEVLVHSKSHIRLGTLDAWLDPAINPKIMKFKWSPVRTGKGKSYMCDPTVQKFLEETALESPVTGKRPRIDLAGPSGVSPKRAGRKLGWRKQRPGDATDAASDGAFNYPPHLPQSSANLDATSNISVRLCHFRHDFFCGTQNTQVRGRWACCRDPTSAPPAT